MIPSKQIDDLAFALLRIGAGIIVLPHGVSQLLGGNASFAHGALALIGVSPSSMMSYLIVYLELIGGVRLVFGFFTRVFAAALAIEMMWVAAVLWANPSGQHDEFEPWEFPLVLALLLLLITAWWRPMVIGPLARKTLTFTSPLDLAMKVVLSLGCFG